MGFPGPRSWTCGCFEPEVRLGKKRVVTGQTTSLQDPETTGHARQGEGAWALPQEAVTAIKRARGAFLFLVNPFLTDRCLTVSNRMGRG